MAKCLLCNTRLINIEWQTIYHRQIIAWLEEGKPLENVTKQKVGHTQCSNCGAECELLRTQGYKGEAVVVRSIMHEFPYLVPEPPK